MDPILGMVPVQLVLPQDPAHGTPGWGPPPGCECAGHTQGPARVQGHMLHRRRMVRQGCAGRLAVPENSVAS